MNCAARLIHTSSKRNHITPLMINLHWLPLSRRIEYKIATICFNVITNSAPPYLSDLLELYIPSRTLRSSADTRMFRIPTRRKKFQGQRACHTLDLSAGTTFPSLIVILNHLHSNINSKHTSSLLPTNPTKP